MDVIVFEKLIIKLLFKNQEARERIIPFLDISIFDDFDNQKIIKNIISFQNKYSKFPSIPELKISIKEKGAFDALTNILNNEDEYDEVFIKGELEKFIRDKLLWNEIIKTTEALKENNQEIISSSSDRMATALSFNFDTSVGLDLFDESDKLWENLHEKDMVIPTGINSVDRLIKGGLHEKTLTLFMAQTNGFKSGIKASIASSCLLRNKHVLYISLEMSEERVAERIIANIFDININDLISIPKDRFIHKFNEVKKTLKSKLVIKEFPSGTMNTNKLRGLVKELARKRKFVPDIIFVDYLGIMASNTFMKGSNTNTEYKVISMELRGLAMEMGIPIVSSVQLNRDGFGDAVIDLTNIADSIGTATNADIIFGVTQTEELRTAGKLNFILLKNRYGINNTTTLVNVNYSRMRVTDENDKSVTDAERDHVNKSADEATTDILNKLNDNKITDKKQIMDIDMGDE